MLDGGSISYLARLRDDVYSEMLVLMQRSSSMLYRNLSAVSFSLHQLTLIPLFQYFASFV